jgi:hypothetical protein
LRAEKSSEVTPAGGRARTPSRQSGRAPAGALAAPFYQRHGGAQRGHWSRARAPRAAWRGWLGARAGAQYSPAYRRRGRGRARARDQWPRCAHLPVSQSRPGGTPGCAPTTAQPSPCRRPRRRCPAPLRTAPRSAPRRRRHRSRPRSPRPHARSPNLSRRRPAPAASPPPPPRLQQQRAWAAPPRGRSPQRAGRGWPCSKRCPSRRGPRSGGRTKSTAAAAARRGGRRPAAARGRSSAGAAGSVERLRR